MRLGVSGYRDYNDYESFSKTIKSVVESHSIDEVNVGTCRGTDQMCIRWCSENGVKCRLFKADWDIYGLKAGPIRNGLIVSNSDIIVAFLHLESKGTKNTISLASKMDKPTLVIKI